MKDSDMRRKDLQNGAALSRVMYVLRMEDDEDNATAYLCN